MRIFHRVSIILSILMLQNPVLAAGWMDGDNAHLTRGKSLYQSGQMDAAVGEFSAAIQANPRLAEAYYWRGIIFSTLKQQDRAQADFDSAISLDRAVPAFYLARATLLSSQNKQELAIADYDAVLRLEPYNQEAQINRKFAQEQLGKGSTIAAAPTAGSYGTAGGVGGAAGGTGEVLPKPKYGNSPTDRAIEKALAKQNGQSLKKLHDEDADRQKAEKTAHEREIAERLDRELQEKKRLARELEELRKQKQQIASVAPEPKIKHVEEPKKKNVDAKNKVDAVQNAAQKPATDTKPEPKPTAGQEMASIQDAAVNVSKANRPIKDKWALIVGISKFKNSELNLRYPSKDAKDFYEYLVTKGNFAPDHVKLLTDKQASKVNILSLLGDKWLPHVANPDDLVVIYISSHGSSSEMDNENVNYLLAYDSDAENLYATGLPMQDLSRIVKARVHSDRVVMILDACHSGAATAESKGLSRGSNVNAEAIAQGTGQLVISSSEPNQVSWESKAEQNSVFTKYLMEGLQAKGPKTSLDDAFQFMKDRVQDEVLRERGVLQTPVLSSKWSGNGLLLGLPPVNPRPGLSVSLPGDEDELNPPAVQTPGRSPVPAGVKQTKTPARTAAAPASAVKPAAKAPAAGKTAKP